MLEIPDQAAPRQWRSRLAAVSWRMSTAALVVFAGGLTYASAVEVGRITRALPPEPPEVSQEVVVRNVRDSEGRRASFRILLFSDEFRWQLSSHAALEDARTQPRFTPEMKAVLDDAVEVICVGTSSEEVPSGLSPDEGRAREERRAALRAERIAEWVRGAVSKPIPVRKLNIGHHAASGAARDTSDQRRVIIILVLDRDDRTNIDEALRAAMVRESERAPVFETLLTKYSLGSGSAFTWVE